MNRLKIYSSGPYLLLLVWCLGLHKILRNSRYSCMFSFFLLPSHSDVRLSKLEVGLRRARELDDHYDDDITF